jgi:peptidoglycan biosynthesis protein MviN/MurJ (putative lipid II flippase)
VLTFALVYYGIRTLKLFKGNVAARAWTYISLSAVFFGIGVIMFLIDSLQPMGLVVIGGAMQTVGALFLFLGLRKNYQFWASKDHFA